MVDGRLVVQLWAGKCKLHTLVDTGATRSLLREDKWHEYRHQHGLPHYLGVAEKIRSLSGDLLPTIGKAEIMLHHQPVPVIVVPSLQHDFLIGDDALRLLRATVDYRSNTLELGGEKVPVVGAEVASVTASAMDHWKSEFPEVFGAVNPRGCKVGVEFTIELEEGTRPIRQRPYRTPLTKRSVIEEQVADMLAQGIIRPSTSPWASPVTLQPKKDNTMRLCVDYRALNAVTKKDAYPLPRVQDIFDSLAGSQLFTCLDLRGAYHQVPVAAESVATTAFVTSRGLFEFLRMPYGVSNAPGFFQRAMHSILGPLLGQCVLVYLDDICVYSANAEDHERDVRAVFQTLKDHGLVVKESKCRFSEPSLKLLGYIVSGDGISPDPAKTSALRSMHAPTDVRGVRSFLGMAGYYRQLIPQFSHHAAPLVQLTRKHHRFHWTEDCQRAFDFLRNVLVSDVVMAHPRVGDPYKLYTDASEYAVGAILTQTDNDGLERPIQYVSKTLNLAQQRWSAIEREAFAVVHALKALRPYLYGAQFEIFTDHKPLKALFLGEVHNTKIQRWNSFIAEYGAPINYTKGSSNIHADMLSRIRQAESTVAFIDTDVGPSDISADPDHLDHRVIADGLDPMALKAAQRELPEFGQVGVDDEYVLQDGYLCTLRPPSGQLTYPRILLPREFQDSITQRAHQEIGHQGGRKTLYRLQRTYKWSGQWKSVQCTVRRCALCQVHGDKRRFPPPSEMPVAHYPGQVMALDLVGPLTPTKDGFRYLVTAIDHNTGWLDASPIKAKTQREVFRYIKNDLVPRYGAPEVLITDQGLEFKGRDLAQYLHFIGTEHRRSTPYHPQTNGRLERAHRTLKALLRKCVNCAADQWEDHVGAALWAYRISRHDASGFSPYFLQYGREPRVPLSRLLSNRQPEDRDAVYRFDLLADVFKQAATNTASSRRYNRERLKQRSHMGVFHVGDKVVILVNERAPLDPHWDFLYTVTAVRGPVVTITDQRSGHRKVLNSDKLLLVDADLDWDHVNPRVKRHRRPPHQPAVAPPASSQLPPDQPQLMAEPDPPLPSTSSANHLLPNSSGTGGDTRETPMDITRLQATKRRHPGMDSQPAATPEEHLEPCLAKRVREAALSLAALCSTA